MGLEKLIKRELVITSLTIVFIVLGFFTFSYALFMEVDTGGNATMNFGDIELRFCEDASCTSELNNQANTIGTQVVSGITSPTVIYPTNSTTALGSTPYSFTLKNVGSLPMYVSIYLTQESSFAPQSSYSNYSSTTGNELNHIFVAFGEAGAGNPTIHRFSELTNNMIINNLYMAVNQTKTFNLWVWVDESTTNTIQGTYFVANISAKSEFIPVSGT